jgi:hypothetical protein
MTQKYTGYWLEMVENLKINRQMITKHTGELEQGGSRFVV